MPMVPSTLFIAVPQNHNFDWKCWVSLLKREHIICNSWFITTMMHINHPYLMNILTISFGLYDIWLQDFYKEFESISYLFINVFFWLFLTFLFGSFHIFHLACFRHCMDLHHSEILLPLEWLKKIIVIMHKYHFDSCPLRLVDLYIPLH